MATAQGNSHTAVRSVQASKCANEFTDVLSCEKCVYYCFLNTLNRLYKSI